LGLNQSVTDFYANARGGRMESVNNDHLSDRNKEVGIHAGIDKAASYIHRVVEKSTGLAQDAGIPEKIARVNQHIRTHPMKAVSAALVVGLVIGLIL
jgi:ElaB/YqjD/DUF883 family membrane-anchored ribosome-binding protein